MADDQGRPQAGAAPAIEPAAYLRLILLGAGIGIPAALAAAGFLGLVHVLESWLWDDLPAALGYTTLPWFLLLGIPVVGAAIALVARRLLPGDGGHAPLGGLSMAPTPVSHVPGVVLAALGTLSFGAILGPEMPVVAIGTSVGVAVQRLAKLDQREAAVLANAGAFSAISALFGGPLVAGMLLVEGGLNAGAALLPALLPGLVSASIGYLIFIGLGNWSGISSAGLTVPNLPSYTGVHLIDLVVALAVGVGAVFAIAGARIIAVRLDSSIGRIGMPALLLLGGVAVGGIAVVCELLGANPNDVLFSGQSALPDLISGQSFGIIALLLVAKVIGYGVSLGNGYRGGPVFPAIFIGVALASLAVVVFGVSPTLAVSVGTAAGMAAQTRLLFSPVLFAALLVGSAGTDTIPPAALAAVAAWLVVTMVTRRGLWPEARRVSPAATHSPG
jgi:H+/Cl- antiporter ClcA